MLQRNRESGAANMPVTSRISIGCPLLLFVPLPLEQCLTFFSTPIANFHFAICAVGVAALDHPIGVAIAKPAQARQRGFTGA